MKSAIAVYIVFYWMDRGIADFSTDGRNLVIGSIE